MTAENKDKAMAVITIDENVVSRFINDFSVKFAKMEMMIETLSRDIELLRKQISEKQTANGRQDISIERIKAVCENRGKLIDELLNFKNKFLFVQIAGNVLTLSIAFLIFRLFK